MITKQGKKAFKETEISSVHDVLRKLIFSINDTPEERIMMYSVLRRYVTEHGEDAPQKFKDVEPHIEMVLETYAGMLTK